MSIKLNSINQSFKLRENEYSTRSSFFSSIIYRLLYCTKIKNDREEKSPIL